MDPSREHRSHPREKLQLRPRSSSLHVCNPYLCPLLIRQAESAIIGGAAVMQVQADSARKDMSLCLVLASIWSLAPSTPLARGREAADVRCPPLQVP